MLDIFDKWSGEIERLKRREGGRPAALVLRGLSNEEGLVGYNFDVGRARAEAVGKALVAYWETHKIEKENILLIGSGEAVRPPYEKLDWLNHPEDNRVDAELCFLEGGADTEATPLPVKAIGQSSQHP